MRAGDKAPAWAQQSRRVRPGGRSPLRLFGTAGDFTGAVHQHNQDAGGTSLGERALKKGRIGSHPSPSSSEGLKSGCLCEYRTWCHAGDSLQLAQIQPVFTSGCF